MGGWVPHDVRNEVVDFVTYWSERGELEARRIVGWIGVGQSKFFSWKKRFGKVNEHNAPFPRDHWITEAERRAILDFEEKNPTKGYRRLTFMMNDANAVAVAPSTVYRVLFKAGRIAKWAPPPTRKGQGFAQPGTPHRDGHIDIAHLNICGTFYYLCTVLDGYSRFVVHWEIREQMREVDIETILQRAQEAFPGARPTIISDNGPQFIAKDFKKFIRVAGMQHIRTSPYYPQSSGKIERWHAVHHRSADVNPFSSYSFHAVEGALLTAWLIPAALLVPLSMPALMITQVVGTANNLMAHLGYELLPAWWIRAPLLRWTNTATFHSLHHTQLKGNYGLFTRLWDRLLGTELPGYEAAFVEAHPPEGAAP